LSADAKTLDANADCLKANPNQLVRVDGNCDERGTNEDNLALGERRAKAAMSSLLSTGHRRGSDHPWCPTATSVRSVPSTTKAAGRGIAVTTSSPSPRSPAGVT